jgi:hypothetical protein
VPEDTRSTCGAHGINMWRKHHLRPQDATLSDYLAVALLESSYLTAIANLQWRLLRRDVVHASGHERPSDALEGASSLMPCACCLFPNFFAHRVSVDPRY